MLYSLINDLKGSARVQSNKEEHDLLWPRKVFSIKVSSKHVTSKMELDFLFALKLSTLSATTGSQK